MNRCAGLVDLIGKPADPLAANPGQLHVFVFTRTDCPVANSYAPEVQRLADLYRDHRVDFQLVYCDPDETSAMIKNHLAEYLYRVPALRDPSREFARRCGVKVTPEVAVMRADGTLAYRGRIDDRYADFGKSRRAATKHDLARAIDCAIAGREVPAAEGSAVGCFIEGL